MRHYLSGPHPPSVVSRGLYAGLKSFNGRHTPLPVVLDDDIYVNAGFIDGLNTNLISQLCLEDIKLRIVFRGSILLQWYSLDSQGEVRHFWDVPATHNKKDLEEEFIDFDVPKILLEDETIVLIYFRILNNPKTIDGKPSRLYNWCYHFNSADRSTDTALLMVSRSFGESGRVIKMYLDHYSHYQELKEQFADLEFCPMPTLDIYESDEEEYIATEKICRSVEAKQGDTLPVSIYRNKYNLGGGGNMLLAMMSSIYASQYAQDFLLLDSDTLIPFKTLYTSAIISAISMSKKRGSNYVYAPIISYKKKPTHVLEAGALFGRGAWNIYSADPIQPCISPIYHAADLSDKSIQAKLGRSLPTDYPPFIYSLYSIRNRCNHESIMSAPFFLRGDDVEYGFHLKKHGISTKVLGSLLVFQDPKHSPWHEYMAILHATVILIAYCQEGLLDTIKSNLYEYFRARHDNHIAIHDLVGLSIYNYVLEKLENIKNVNKKELLPYFYNPDAYLSLRHLNKTYSEHNYLLAGQIDDEAIGVACKKIPFLYYNGLEVSSPMPKQVFLLNHLSKTAAILSPSNISHSDVSNASLKYLSLLSNCLGDLDLLRICCQRLLNRSSLKDFYQSNFCDATS